MHDVGGPVNLAKSMNFGTMTEFQSDTKSEFIKGGPTDYTATTLFNHFYNQQILLCYPIICSMLCSIPAVPNLSLAMDLFQDLAHKL